MLNFMRIITLLFAFVAAAFAETPAEENKPVPEKFNAPKEVAPGVFEIGVVRVDKTASTVSFPAKVNMVDGLLEYLLVTPQGSAHESLFVTDAPPKEVHMAMLLLGAKGMEQPKDGAAQGRIDSEFLARAPKLTGDKITITAVWKDKDGKEQVTPVERWIVRMIHSRKKASETVPAADGPWLYTGSYFYGKHFVAQTEGSLASLVTYPGALINNPRSGSNDDHQWYVNKETVPPKDTPVTFTIKLEPK